MTIEEKAKTYDKVVNKLRHFIMQGVDPLITRADVQDFFPELKESEDERIRKELIDYINRLTVTPNNIDKYNTWVAWLEKKGAQNTFLDELEMTLSVSEDAYLRSNLEKLIKTFKNDAKRKTELTEMLEVDGFWTEEDESKVGDIVYFLDTAKIHYASTKALDDCITWLKSLKQRMGVWEIGYKDVVRKAYNWLIDRYENQGVVLLDDINELKQVLEEQQ